MSKEIFIRKQHQILLYLLIFSLLLGLGAQLMVGAPAGNLLAMIIGGTAGIVLIALFHYKERFKHFIPYIAIFSVAVIALIIMQSSDYFTNILFVFYLLAVAAMALSRNVLLTSGVLGVLLIVYFAFADGEAAGMDSRAIAMTFVFFTLVFMVLYFIVKNTGKLMENLEESLHISALALHKK